jgi:23S rRNA (cytidine1920-2'-O)/16S rRNA (cytidine1409-2'-O)-methyltransferase
VVNCEGVNARFITDDFFEYMPTFMSVDLSFISLSLVVPALVQSLENDGEIAALIKPQFEAGKSALNKKGICRNKKDHVRVLTQLFDMFESLGLGILGAVPSAIKGGDGNTEYLVHLKKGAVTPCVIDIKKLCDSAFSDEEK